MKTFVQIVIIALFCIGCNPKKAKDPAPAPTEIVADTQGTQVDTANGARNSLDYIGLYKGKLPCADCAGVETRLELSEDFSYVLTRKYLGRNDKEAEIKGTFKWNASGNGIVLSNLENEPNQFAVAENTLTQLDLHGHKVEGKLANGYILKKMTEAEAIRIEASPEEKQPVKITAIHWKLSELYGKPVKPIGDKDYYIAFKTDNSFTAFGGCNRIAGKYDLKGSGARMFQIISTMMACPEMKTEGEFKKALELSDNFVANEKVLQFRKGATNLLKFEAGPSLKK